MATVAELLVKIGANSFELRKELAATQRQMKRAFGPEALEASQKAAGLLGALSAAIGGVGVASVIMAGKMSTSRAAFETLLGDAQKAKVFLEDLAQFAAETPFEFEGLQDTAKKLLAFKFAAEDIIPIMTAIGDAAGMLGSGQEGIDRMTLAIAQMQSKGKIQSQEMLQLAEAGVNAWQYLADSMGMSISDVMDKVSKGEVDAQTGINAIILGMQRDFKGGMERQAKEIPGLWSTILNNTKIVMTNAGEGLIKALGIKERMQGLANFLSDFAATVKQVGIGQALKDMIPPSLTIAILGMAGAITGAAVPAIKLMSLNIMKALIPLALNPWVIALTAVGTAIGGVIYLVNQQNSALNKQIQSFKSQGSELGSLIGQYKDLSSKVNLTAGEKQKLYDISNKIAEIAPQVVTGYTKEGNAIIDLNAALKAQIALKRQELSLRQTQIAKEIKDTEELIKKDKQRLENEKSMMQYRLSQASNASVTKDPDIFRQKVLADYNAELRKNTASTAENQQKLSQLKQEYETISNLLQGKMVQSLNETNKGLNKTFTGLHSKSNFGGADKAYEGLKKNAKQVSESIQSEWVQTTKTQLEQLDIWKAEQFKALEETRAVNKNYQRDVERVNATYSARRLKILQDEQQKTNQIWDQAADRANNLKKQLGSIGLTGVDKQKFDIDTDAADKIEAIKRTYRDWANEYSTSTEKQKEEFRKAWEANSIQFEVTAQGMVDFSKQIASEEIAVEKEKQQQISDLHYERVKYQESLDEAYNEGHIQRYTELLGTEQALLAQDLAGRQAMMDTYYTIWQDSHRTAMSYMAEAMDGLYSGLTDFFADIINNAKSIGDAWDSLRSKFLTMLGQMVAQWLSSRIMMWATEKLFGGKQLGLAMAQGAATASAWAPAAAMVSLATMGGNAAAAMSGITMTTGLAVGLAKLPALAEGGITTGPTIAEIGEGRYKEAVLPLNKKYFEKAGLIGGHQEQQPIIFSPTIKALDSSDVESWLENGGGAKFEKYFRRRGRSFVEV